MSVMRAPRRRLEWRATVRLSRVIGDFDVVGACAMKAVAGRAASVGRVNGRDGSLAMSARRVESFVALNSAQVSGSLNSEKAFLTALNA